MSHAPRGLEILGDRMKTYSILILVVGLGMSGKAFADCSDCKWGCDQLNSKCFDAPSNTYSNTNGLLGNNTINEYTTQTAPTATPMPISEDIPRVPNSNNTNILNPSNSGFGNYLNNKNVVSTDNGSGGTSGGTGSTGTPTAKKPDTTAAGSAKGGGTGSGQACGDNGFGGASCDTTDAINMGIGVANKMVQTIGTAAVQNKGTDVQNTLNSKGINVTNADYLNGQADAADAAKDANNKAGYVETGNMALQLWRAMAHKKSVSTVKAVDCQKDPNPDDCEKNKQAEVNKQKNKAIESVASAALTAEQAGMSFMNASMAAKTAEELRKQALLGSGAAAGTNYSFTPPTQAAQDPGVGVTATPAVDTGAVTSSSPGDPLAGGTKDFNPNIGNNGVAGPAPGAFNASDQKGAGGGGQGASLGGSGGTSASKDDGSGGKAESAAIKGQTGGQYASGDSGSPKFSRSGGSGGGGVGMDTSFSDLLKKMLPGADDKKDDKNASLELDQDRSPASNQAAVMGRNKNIFIEISKRYQKKNSEGAVTFQ